MNIFDEIDMVELLFGECYIAINEDGTIAVLPPTEAPTAPVEKPKADDKESIDDVKKRARKPPSEGPCSRCGLLKPINRLKLCYRCWTMMMLEKGGWKEGQEHPSSCGCDLDCRFDKKGVDN